MGRAGTTAPLELALKSLTSAVEFDHRIVRRQAERACKIGHALTFEVDAPDEVGILGLQRRQEFVQTLADRGFEITLDFYCGRAFERFLCQRSCLGATVAVVVDERVAQEAVEPSHRTLAVGQGLPLLERAHEGVLQDLFGDGSIAHTPLEEVQEATMIRHQPLDDEFVDRADGVVSSHGLVGYLDQSFTFLSLSALAITETELRLMAALAIIGLSRIPNTGYSTPAAIGTPSAL